MAKGKEAEEARRFVETFALDGEGEDALRRSLNMLHEAKGNGRIEHWAIHGSREYSEDGNGRVLYAVDITARGSVDEGDPDFDPRSVFVSACVTRFARFPEAVRRALRHIDETKRLAAHCDRVSMSTGRLKPAARMSADAWEAEKKRNRETYAVIWEESWRKG